MPKPSTKSYVLQKLEQNKGSYITGMDLASELGVSRNAIWKAINELKKDGYVIYSTNNKGYALDEGSDILSVTAIKECLENIRKSNSTKNNPDGKGAGRKKAVKSPVDNLVDSIIIYDELVSTNQTAKMNLITGAMDKKVIIARTQTGGIGHNKSSFDSPEGGIYMSIILDDISKNTSTNTPLKTSDIGQTVSEILEKLTGKKTSLDKKYNRISINKKVICGILTEYFADLETNTISGYVIGIGIKDIGISKNMTVASILDALNIQ